MNDIMNAEMASADHARRTAELTHTSIPHIRRVRELRRSERRWRRSAARR